MNEITIPYHLAVPSLICILGLLAILLFRNKLFKKNKILWIAITVFLVFYLFIVGGATYDDIYYQWDLNRYDLNQDGIFSGEEITEAQKEAMNRLINDVGRNFSFVMGFIFSFIISSVVYVSGRIIQFVIQQRKTK